MEHSDKTPNMWTDLLPTDLLISISTRLHSPIGSTRLRSVCSSWRSSLPPPSPSPSIGSTLSSLLEHAVSNFDNEEPQWDHIPSLYMPGTYISLDEATVYFLQPAADPTHSGKVVTVERSRGGNLRALHPLSLFAHSPNSIDLSDLRIFELAKFYYINNDKHPGSDPDDSDIDSDSDWVISMMFNREPVLRSYRAGDDDELVGVKIVGFDDAVCRNGKFYYALYDGDVHVYDNDSDYEVVKSLESDSSFGESWGRYLVEAGGSLYLLAKNKYQDVEAEEAEDATLFKVFRLDDSRREWERVYDVGDFVFFETEYGSFSVAGSKFPALGVNCVYFNLNEFKGHESDAVFDLQSGVWRRLSDSGSSIFVWPPSFRSSADAAAI